jgi:hypothetical protein
MISLRRATFISLLTIISVVIVLIGLVLFMDAKRKRIEMAQLQNDMAKAEQAAVKIEAYRQKNGHYPDQKDKQAFKSMGLQFDQDFNYYSSDRLYDATPESPTLVISRESGCKGSTYELSKKRWVSWEMAC